MGNRLKMVKKIAAGLKLVIWKAQTAKIKKKLAYCGKNLQVYGSPRIVGGG